jgi:hypothetical protein
MTAVDPSMDVILQHSDALSQHPVLFNQVHLAPPEPDGTLNLPDDN